MLVNIENDNKKAVLISKSSYYKYSIGDRVTMQEIIYKYKDEIYSDIIFAKSSHYKKEEEFKNKYTGNVELFDDMYIDKCINSYHKDKEVKLSSFKVIFIPIFLCLFILTAVDMSKHFKEKGYTLTYGSKLDIGGFQQFKYIK